MRRLLAVLLVAPLLVAWGTRSSSRPDPADDRAKGLVYDGLRKVGPDHPCRGGYSLGLMEAGRELCSHGPDPAPPGVDVRRQRQPAEVAPPGQVTAGELAPGTVPCVGNGTDGARVQLVYARPSDQTDRYGAFLANFRTWATQVDAAVDASAAETGGSRHVRFVHDASCVPLVDQVVLPTTTKSNFSTFVSEMRARGFNRTDRKYLVWTDANALCGISQLWVDDSPGQTNLNNGASGTAGTISRVDNGCWGLAGRLTEVHELAHALGAVQPKTSGGGPAHATPGYHCTDEYDRLCYNDGSGGGPIQFSCPSTHEALLDCNHDDYFSTSPAAGSYLATHWNTANNRFLIAGAAAPPPSTTTVPPTTVPPTTTRPPSTTTTTTRPPTTTTTTGPPATTTAVTTTFPPVTTAPPAGGLPSAPQSLMPVPLSSGETGVRLSWRPPTSSGSSPLTGYRVYRGASATGLAFVGTSTTTAYHDVATTSGAVYYYQVAAVNSAGEGPRSQLTRMVAR